MDRRFQGDRRKAKSRRKGAYKQLIGRNISTRGLMASSTNTYGQHFRTRTERRLRRPKRNPGEIPEAFNPFG